MTQGRVLLSPKLMHPKMGTEMRRPDLPKLRYSHLDASREAFRCAGSWEDISIGMTENEECEMRCKLPYLMYSVVE